MKGPEVFETLPSKCRVGCEDDKSVSQETEGARGRVCTRSERVQEEDGHANPEDPATSEAFHRILVLDQNVSLWIVNSPASFSNSGTTFPLFESLGNRSLPLHSHLLRLY